MWCDLIKRRSSVYFSICCEARICYSFFSAWKATEPFRFCYNSVIMYHIISQNIIIFIFALPLYFSFRFWNLLMAGALCSNTRNHHIKNENIDVTASKIVEKKETKIKPIKFHIFRLTFVQLINRTTPKNFVYSNRV